MKITDVEAICLAGRRQPDAFGVLVRVTTDEGTVGYGETNSVPRVIKAIIEAPYYHEVLSGLKPLLLGHDPSDPEALWRRMLTGTRGYGRSGAVIQAMAAIDIALWDIRGKLAGRPVHALLGPMSRDRLRVYGTHSLGTTLEETARLALQMRDRGFSAVKFGWAPLGPNAEADEAIVRTLRRTLGESVDLLIDAGNAWDAETAIERCQRFEPYRLYWLEEPLAPDDFAGYAHVTATVPTRIAAGELLQTYGELSRLVLEGRVGVIQVDVSRVGLTEAMRIAHLADAHGVPCVNHTYALDGDLLASLHFAAAAPRTLLFEYPARPNELREALFHDRVVPVNGVVRVPDGPGLGLHLDLAALERFRVH
jgi:L-rhamnonate dehydratase